MPGVEPGVATAAIAILPCNTGGIPGHDRLAWYRAPGRVKPPPVGAVLRWAVHWLLPIACQRCACAKKNL